MQYRMINKFTVSLVFSLFVSTMASAFADNTVMQPQYPVQLAGGKYKPWVLPPTTNQSPDSRYLPRNNNPQYPRNQAETQYPGYRFVTPEILESLKQQQMQYQQMPTNESSRYRPPQSGRSQQNQWQQPSVLENYGYPPMAGMGYSNPLYDAPAASSWNTPWGGGPDVSHQGQSFPWLPDAAIGGIPPMPVQPLIENDYGRGPENGVQGYENNVFNPFTFGPNGNL